MQIFLYCPQPQANSVVAPVLDYFACRYDAMDGVKAIEDLSGILSKWKYVQDNNGKVDDWYAKKQHNFDFIEIHVKKSKILLRFPYYLDSINNRIVILMGYEKSDGYKPRSKEAREVHRKQLQAQEYYNDYHLDHSRVVELPENFNNLMK